MHLTLKKEATRPPGMNSLQQQARFDDFVQEFNNYDLGFIDLEQKTLQPLDNPFGTGLSPMS
jgi:hypothetical protein